MDRTFSAQWDSLEARARQRDDYAQALRRHVEQRAGHHAVAGRRLDDESPDFKAPALAGDDPQWLPGSPGPFGLPPILAVLVAAVRATSLKRLYPFMSLGRFCLGDGLSRNCDRRGQVAPAFVAYDHSGYTVFRGGPHDDDGDGPDQDWAGAWGTVTLRTRDETAAAAELERLLVGWPNRS